MLHYIHCTGLASISLLSISVITGTPSLVSSSTPWYYHYVPLLSCSMLSTDYAISKPSDFPSLSSPSRFLSVTGVVVSSSLQTHYTLVSLSPSPLSPSMSFAFSLSGNLQVSTVQWKAVVEVIDITLNYMLWAPMKLLLLNQTSTVHFVILLSQKTSPFEPWMVIIPHNHRVFDVLLFN